MQIDKCKTCVQYIVINEHDNNIFYGCRMGKSLIYKCNPQKQGCPNCMYYKMPKICPWTNQRVASTGEVVGICNRYLEIENPINDVKNR